MFREDLHRRGHRSRGSCGYRAPGMHAFPLRMPARPRAGEPWPRLRSGGTWDRVAVDRRGHSIVAHLHDVVQPRGTISVVATAEDEAPRSPRGRALLRRRAGKRAAARPTSRSSRPPSRPMPLYAAACGPNRRSRRSRVSRFVAVSFIEDPSMVRPSDSNAKSFDTSNFDPSSRARPAAGIISGTHGRPLPVSVSNDASIR